MAKKKNNKDGFTLCGNNANDVTGSCILGVAGGHKFLLECGMTQINDTLESYKVNSKKFPFNPKEIEYVFVNHAHIDHTGLIPRLAKEGFHGEIVCTRETSAVMKLLLENSCHILKSDAERLSFQYKRNYAPIFSECDVKSAMSMCRCFTVGTEHKLNDNLSFEFIPNSHCVGAVQLRLNITNAIGVKKSVLYTSDIGSINNRNSYVTDTIIDNRHYALTIMESTYGDKTAYGRKCREKDIEKLTTAINTTLEQNGTVILPCFSFARTQEMLTILVDILNNKNQKQFSVFVDSKLSCDVCREYKNILSDNDKEKWNKVMSHKNVRFITEKTESLEVVKNHAPKVVISSSGFCTNGRVLSYLHEYLPDENSTIIFSGFTGTDASYLSYKIKNHKEYRDLKISGDKIKNKANIVCLSSMSNHAGYCDLVSFGGSLNTNKIVLVHGSQKAKDVLKQGITESVSKKAKTCKIQAATKDMFIAL